MKKFITLAFAAFAAAGAAAQQPQSPQHVFLIGIDGFTSRAVGLADLPTMTDMIRHGSWTLHKRSIYPTNSAPNWASLYMGVPPETHGYFSFAATEPEIPLVMEFESGRFPCIFSVLREQRPELKTAFVYEWGHMRHYADVEATDFHVAAEGYLDNPLRCAEIATDYIMAEKPDFMSVVFSSTDDTGHSCGFDSEEYLSRLELVDGEIRKIIDATRSAGIFENSVFIVTSDHGAIETGHGGYTIEEIETPLIIMGSGILENNEIHAATAQYDIAPTILSLFGVVAPELWTGRPLRGIFAHDINDIGAADTPSAAPLAATRYYEISGTAAPQKPDKGLVIKQEILTDGTSRSSKQISTRRAGR